MPWMRAKPVTSVAPKRAFHSSKSLPSTMRAMISRGVVGLARVGRNECRRDRRPDTSVLRRWRTGSDELRVRADRPRQSADDAARDAERMCVVLGQVIDDAGNPGVHFAAAEFLGADHFAGGGFHQRRTAEKNRALVADDDGFVAHRRHVSAAGSARTHDHRDLRNASRRHVGLVEEDAAEMFRRRETLRPGSAGARRPNPRGTRRAAGFPRRRAARADAS